ncbi:MAG: hypothetical protein JO236_01515 [Mycobacterium sp.]|uniref:hypothetical protein n=1 Tax=Mycobacterium sp. TaxID=1785 RepID=UPI001ECAB435|nr:hypothetical protein [Mycobacterium sp.]MBW0016218.1 hypothetical protein [Mycobacterium sp.]
MKTAEFVLLLVLGIAALQALVWIPIIVWLRRKYRAALATLTAGLQGETVLRAPEKARYRGASAPNYPAAGNNGVIALSRRRLVFLTVTGKSIEIPVSEIRGVREAKVFKSAVVGGKTHLVVQLLAGEVAFFVVDNAAWMTAINSLAAQRK